MSEDQAAAVNARLRELGVIEPAPANVEELPPEPAQAIPPTTKPPPAENGKKQQRSRPRRASRVRPSTSR